MFYRIDKEGTAQGEESGSAMAKAKTLEDVEEVGVVKEKVAAEVEDENSVEKLEVHDDAEADVSEMPVLQGDMNV